MFTDGDQTRLHVTASLIHLRRWYNKNTVSALSISITSLTYLQQSLLDFASHLVCYDKVLASSLSKVRPVSGPISVCRDLLQEKFEETACETYPDSMSKLATFILTCSPSVVFFENIWHVPIITTLRVSSTYEHLRLFDNFDPVGLGLGTPLSRS